ncbi:putative inner membrane protein [Yersinia enterocolitica]|nr:putative inner membrane protein [Yersinia enterocolitica]
MDIYLNPKSRFIEYYQSIAMTNSDTLLRVARDVSRFVLRDALVRARFENEIKDFISEQMKIIKSARTESDCKIAIDNLNKECSHLLEQDLMLKTKRAKTVVAIELKKDRDTWGYVIQGVYLTLGGLTILGGITLTAGSLASGNIIGVMAGVTIVLHGANSLQEIYMNLKNDTDSSTGLIQNGYIATAEFLGFEKKVGALAYNFMSIGLSGYGMARMVLKPDAWRLFRHIPTDYVRNIKTMGYGSLAIEGTGNALSVKAINDSK